MIQEGWSYVSKIMARDIIFRKLMNYMERFWIKNKYIKNSWTIFRERHHTNNCVGSRHSALNKNVGRRKPNLVYLLNKLKEEADFSTIRIINTSSNKRTNNQIKYDAFIQDCEMELINGDISVAHFLEKVK